MTQTIRISGIRAEGRHGARKGERDAPQPFVVDLEIEVDAARDDLGTTADYREVSAAVRTVITDESHAIIETIAGRIAETVAAMNGVRTCRAVVHKPEAATRLKLADVSAEALAKGSYAP
jgi:dihydroneopterin aldolase